MPSEKLVPTVATPIACELPDCWGVDCSQKLTANELFAFKLQSAICVRFVVRYVFFGPPRPGDLDLSETQTVLDAGLTLLVVQHVRDHDWSPSKQLGDSDGGWAAKNAEAAGYPPGLGLHIALDLEGVAAASWGAPTIEHAETWCSAVLAGGYRPVIYVGYKCGLTPQQLYDLPNVDRYWSDAGPRSVVTRGFCMKQHAEITMAGIFVDPDHHSPDALNGVLTGLCAPAAVPGLAVALLDPVTDEPSDG